MSARIAMIVGLALTLVTGCATTSDAGRRAPARVTTRPAPVHAIQTASLLFDRQRGWYRPDDFAGRSDWPSTDAYTQTGQSIYFREHFVDYQGRGFHDSGYTYRRFETYRTGTGYR